MWFNSTNPYQIFMIKDIDKTDINKHVLCVNAGTIYRNDEISAHKRTDRGNIVNDSLFKQGDWVICINPDPDNYLRKNHVYRILDVFIIKNAFGEVNNEVLIKTHRNQKRSFFQKRFALVPINEVL